MNYSYHQIILVLATVIGAWGGFPSPPPRFQSLINTPLFQWFLVFVLAYQGGAGGDPVLAGLATGLLYSLDKALRY